MPLDTSTYNLALLRVDGRRWNDLRRLHGQIRTQAAADGSSYLEMGNTKVTCVVTGPTESARGGGAAAVAAASAGGGSAASSSASIASTPNGADVAVTITVGGFSTVDRRRRARGDKRTQELQAAVARALAGAAHAHLYPRSTIAVSLHVLAQDGGLLAALVNAATLALVDAGIPLTDYVAACTAGSTSSYAANDEGADPLLDLNLQEETELPFLTLATLGATDRVALLVCESRVQLGRLEGMMAVAADGCKHIRSELDRIVREKGAVMIREGAIAKGDAVAMGL